jgi:TatD DNase family protein
MNLPQTGDYIDIHTHGGKPSTGIFIIENLMAHETILPVDLSNTVFSLGIHPWFLNKSNHKNLLNIIYDSAGRSELIAIGEAGFDKLRGPEPDLQREVFEEQVRIAGAHSKPLIIHCVKAWEELLASHKKLKPKTPWLIHGFRGNKELADQLLSKGMYLSFWYDFVIRPESSKLLKSWPTNRIFLETDGADIDIREIYRKVAIDLDITIDELKVIISNNFNLFFNPNYTLTTE